MISPTIRKKLEEKGFDEKQIDIIDNDIVMQWKKENGYKIMTGRRYTVYKKVFGNMTFYSIQLVKRLQDGTQLKAYKQVKFINCDSPQEDKTEILVNHFFEDFYFKKDDKYNPVFIVAITDWVIADKETREEKQALAEYNSTMYKENFSDNTYCNYDEDVSIDDNFLD